MGVLSFIAPGLFMALGGLAIGVACASAYERGFGAAITLASTGAAILFWAAQAFLWVQIGAAGP